MQRLRKLYGGLWISQVTRHIPFMAAGLIAIREIRKLLSVGPEDPDVAALSRAQPYNLVTEMDLALSDVADSVADYPDLRERLEAQADDPQLSDLEDLAGGAEFAARFAGFLDDYGMRCNSEIDASRPRWREDSRSLRQTILTTVAAGEAPGTHRRRHQRLAEEARAAGRRLIERARARSRIRGWRMARLVRVYRNLGGAREHPKFMLIRYLEIARNLLLDLGQDLVTAGCLEQAADVWYLNFEELQDIFESAAGPAGSETLQPLVAARRREAARHAGLNPPRVMTSEGEAILGRHALADVPEGALIGTPVSPGVVEGRARVVTDPNADRLEAGEILVAPFTDPGWTPLFLNAAGLVMEVGGVMSHGSVVAREYGLPAVVCVPQATREITTGMRIRVDGTRGYVVELKDAAAE